MDKIITAFFYEVINRIIPGFVFVGLYYNQEVEKTFQRFQQLELYIAMCILLAAWLIGIMLDAVTWWPFRCLMFISCFKEWIGEDKSGQNPESQPEEMRLHFVKLQAEKTMFRVLLTISLLTFFNPPNGLFVREWQPLFSWFGVFTFGPLFLLAAFHSRKKTKH